MFESFKGKKQSRTDSIQMDISTRGSEVRLLRRLEEIENERKKFQEDFIVCPALVEECIDEVRDALQGVVIWIKNSIPCCVEKPLTTIE